MGKDFQIQEKVFQYRIAIAFLLFLLIEDIDLSLSRVVLMCAAFDPY